MHRPTNQNLFSVLAVMAALQTLALVSAHPAWSMGKFRRTPTAEITMQPVGTSELPVFADDMAYEALGGAVAGSLSYYRKLPPEKPIAFGGAAYPVSHLIRSLETFLAFIEKKPSAQALSAFIADHYTVYAFTKAKKPAPVLFTGYYEPLLKGSRTRAGVFQYPVYPRPADLVSFNLSDFSTGCDQALGVGRLSGTALAPYYSRKQIEMEGALAGLIPLAWVDDPVELFFLHIQGSGKIRMAEGDTLNVHYVITNGHPYRSIGGYLIEKKKMEKEAVSMQSIKDYLHRHPEEVREILHANPRYVFFETRDNGPVGCFQINLTPGRSLALDRRITPPGALAFITARKPMAAPSGKAVASWTPFSRFVLNQDTGSAILGPGRADIFWGNGDYAELAAGYMKETGNLYFPVLKDQ